MTGRFGGLWKPFLRTLHVWVPGSSVGHGAFPVYPSHPVPTLHVLDEGGLSLVETQPASQPCLVSPRAGWVSRAGLGQSWCGVQRGWSIPHMPGFGELAWPGGTSPRPLADPTKAGCGLSMAAAVQGGVGQPGRQPFLQMLTSSPQGGTPFPAGSLSTPRPGRPGRSGLTQP